MCNARQPRPLYTVEDAHGRSVGYGRTESFAVAREYVRSCNEDEWEGKDQVALPFRVVRCA